jgi:predicted DCC family thiol-disulfide oxidoreductase YuxK
MRPERNPQLPDSGPGARVGDSILFYDGVCGLCSRLVRFLLARDRDGRLKFAPLQGSFASETLARHGHDPARLDTVYLLTALGTSEERVQRKSRAVLAALTMLPGAWRLAGALRIIPRFLLDAFYDAVARVRYRVFGRTDQCRIPAPEERQRFIDAGPGPG